MATPIRTVYNQLTDLLMGRSPDSPGGGGLPPDFSEPRVLKANSTEERAELVLQTQQNQHFRTQMMQLFQAESNKRLYYEGTRLEQYRDYEAMEEYPDIARALDLLAEEATMGSINGKALNIYSDNERTKAILHDLFYNTLDVPVQLSFWARNMIKHGDCFLYHPLAAGRGILGARLLSTIDTERQETVVNDEPTVRFRYLTGSGHQHEYTLWQVSHFRMLGNERRLPYGTSLLYRIRRTYKMLVMAKDAVLVYRLTRAPERRVHKIFTGNIDPNDVPAYLTEVSNSHKKAKLMDPRTGDFNWTYQPATMDMDYYVGVSSENAGTQIETLPGAQNLDALGDVRMLEDDLFGGLGIPKSFIKFNSDTGGSAGDGKSMSMLDIRLARLINRIQQALLGELNKMAIVHLHLLGGDFQDETSNFTLTMNSPSVQLELQQEELRSAKLDNFTKATTPGANGMAAMSYAEGMKDILGKSEQEIKQSLYDQFTESKIASEIKLAPELLPSSRLYDPFIRFAQASKKNQTSTSAEPGADGMGGDMGMGGMGAMDALPPAGGGDGFPAGPGAGPAPGPLNEQTMQAGLRLLQLAQLL